MHRAPINYLLLLLVTIFCASAHAAGVTVTGVVMRPSKVEAPEPKLLGFLPPLENPIVELRQYDPFPEMFVFLEGGPADDSGARSSVVWQLGSHSFSPPIQPVMTGSPVEIANVGRETHLLATVGSVDLVDKDPLGPGSSKSFMAPAAGSVVRIVSRTSPHLEGRIVTLPSRLYGRLDRNGKFKIENVPPGKWTVKVWYRDGWANLPPRIIEVPAKAEVRIDLTNDSLAPAPADGQK